MFAILDWFLKGGNKKAEKKPEVKKPEVKKPEVKLEPKKVEEKEVYKDLNIGTAKIRVRSLKAAVDERTTNNFNPKKVENYTINRVPFTKSDKKNHTIIFPQEQEKAAFFKAAKKQFIRYGPFRPR